MIDKEYIRRANPIEAVAERYGVKLRRNGGGTLVGLCPLHDERSPSFTIWPASQSFYCFGCGAGGDVFDLVMRREGIDFKTALKRLSNSPPSLYPAVKTFTALPLAISAGQAIHNE